MLVDREQLLTPLAGQLFNANDTAAEVGSSEYDLMAAGHNPAVGEPIGAYFMLVGSDVNNVTSLTFEIVASDDAAGSNVTSLVSKTVLLASLTEASGVQKIGILNTGAIGSTYQYLLAKVTTNGTPATTGLIRIWLKKSDTDAYPHNAANKL